MLDPGFHLRASQFCSASQAYDRGHVFSSGPPSTFLYPTFHERHNAHSFFYPESADTLGPVQLVCREAHHVDLQIVDVDRHLAHSLRGVRVQQDALRATHSAHLFQRLDHADFIIGQHHGDQNRVIANCVGNLRSGNPARLWTGCRCDWQKRDVETAACQALQRIEDRFVFRLDANDVIPLATWSLHRAPNRQVVAFGCTACEYDLTSRRSDRLRDGLATSFYRIVRLPPENVTGTARIAILLREERQHRIDDARVNSRRRLVVHENRCLHHGLLAHHV